MTGNHKFEIGNRDRLDDHIDAALAKYATAAPRPGLEERVLANLRGQPTSSGAMVWWRWAGVAAVFVLITTFLVWRLEKPGRERVVDHRPITRQETQPQVAVKDSSVSIRKVVPVSSRQVRKTIRLRAVMVAAEPRLEQFPSPQPLTPEELALARYVKEFPEEATLIARAQDELEKQLQQKIADASSQTEPASLDQKER